MKYDFTTTLDRSKANSTKWNDMYKQDPNVPENIVPLSVADMEFINAPQIRDGLKKMIDTTVLGYTGAGEEYYNSIINWMEKRHNYTVKKEWILTTAGVVPALFTLVKSMTELGDGVIIMTPVYYPFKYSAVMTGRNLVENALINNNGHYEIDYADLEEKAKDTKNKIILLSSPHNPVGRVWTREELEKVSEICCKHNVFVVSDEIHHDIIMPGNKHIVFSNISKEAAKNCAICTAPSKTFNLAGVQCSNIIIENEEVKQKMFNQQISSAEFSLNIFAYKACEIAYNECEEWLAELITVIDTNRKLAVDFFKENIPEVSVINLEGSYLLWTDFRKLPINYKDLADITKKEAYLFLDEGYMFGELGQGFERFNLACPTQVLKNALDRLLIAMNRHRAVWKEKGVPKRIKLTKGDKIESFIYNTAFEANKSFAEKVNHKKTFVIFSRYYGCPLCQMDLHHIKQRYAEFEAKGTQVVVLLQSDPKLLKEKLGDKDAFPFEIICDPKREIYKMYNMNTADDMFDLGGGNTIPKVMQSMQEGYVHGEYEGEEAQLPAIALINEDMVIQYAHYAKDLADIPSIDEMLTMI